MGLLHIVAQAEAGQVDGGVGAVIQFDPVRGAQLRVGEGNRVGGNHLVDHQGLARGLAGNRQAAATGTKGRQQKQ